jgi:hypothetical protein
MQILHWTGKDLYEKDFVFEWPILITDSKVSLKSQEIEKIEYIGTDYTYNIPIEFQNDQTNEQQYSVEKLLELYPEYFINFNINKLNFIDMPTRFRSSLPVNNG